MNDLITDICGHGDTPPFEEIFRLYHRRVYGLCLRMTANVAEAEDLTQDVFVQVFRKMGSFRGEAAFGTWLHRVTVNQVLMHFRKNHVRKEKTTEDGEMPVMATEVHSRPGQSSILDRVILNEVIARLPLGYRTVLILHDVKGLQHDEIAQTLRCSIGTSKSQLYKARRKLRALLTRRTASPTIGDAIYPEPVN